ncbi:hypothetical protein [Acholeplasma hippikon]|uniref:SynChlorMet cassette protein ScmC n=1 Tax=Acholeplasma hippikon TaxID=264636 RepID=A0A449BKG8_9MOLU|nr:hypothetical protein [Acholeplasma hippikon]VEU82920.1 Uncharacterised protein [Acholeplasma hippikon]
MKKYLIAGIKIEFNYQYDKFFKNNIEKYAYEGNDIDHTINVHFNDVLEAPQGENFFVFSKSVSGYKAYMLYDENLRNINLWIDLDAFNDAAVAEYIYAGMIFMYLAQRRGLVAVSGTAINYQDDVLLFVAPAGTGKTTHAMMWKENFTNEVEFITDLKPLLYVNDNAVYVYSTPFSELNTNKFENNKVKAIIYLNRGAGEHIKVLDKKEGLSLLTDNTIKPAAGKITDIKDTLKLINELTPAYLFDVSLNKKSPIVAKKSIYNN